MAAVCSVDSLWCMIGPMIWFILLFGAIAAAAGWFFHRAGVLVTLTAALLSGFLVASIAGPLTWTISTAIMKADKETYQEFWGGYEVATSFSVQPCEKNGYCQNEYNCDAYIYTWTTYSTDSKGNTTSTTHTETRYHQCPYSSEETTYRIETSFGTTTVGTYMTGPEYRPHERSIPGGQVTEPPAIWTAAKNRIDSGQPGAAFKQNSYRNLLHASESTILKQYSEDIEIYKGEGLLPAIGKDLHDIYRMDKAQFPEVSRITPDLQKELSKDAMQLSAGLGSELQGDLRVVFVDELDVRSGDAEKYGLTLMAYWQSKEMGKFAVPKNAVVVIVGVGGTKNAPVADWVRAYTGMPVGNEQLTADIQSKLVDQPIDGNFLGSPTLKPGADELTRTDGKLESSLFGAHKFERVSMSGKDESDIGTGFEYLSEGWEPEDGQQVLIYVLSTFFSLLLLIPFVFLARMEYDGPRGRHILVDPLGVLFGPSES